MHTEAQFTIQGRPVQIVDVRDKKVDEGLKTTVQETYGKLPLYFIRNDGHMDERVKFYERGSGHSMFYTGRGIYLSLVKGQKSEPAGWIKQGESTNPVGITAENRRCVIRDIRYRINRPASRIMDYAGNTETENPKIHNSKLPDSQLIKLTLLGANKHSEITAEGIQEGKVNYLVGSQEHWRTNIPTYQSVLYKDIYKGIDMRFYGNNRQLEYDVIVKPGADPSRVRFAYRGIEGLKVTEDGDLEISLEGCKIIQKKPYAYQEIDGKRVEVDGKFRVLSTGFGVKNQKSGIRNSQWAIRNPKSKIRNLSTVFRLPHMIRHTPLSLIPPCITPHTWGGNGDDYSGSGGIAVDGSGYLYVTGYTASSKFPTASAYQGSHGGKLMMSLSRSWATRHQG